MPPVAIVFSEFISLRQVFARNLLFVLGVNLLVKPVWIFAIDRTVQNKVGHEAFGTYQPLFNLCLIFQILLDFGINSYNSKTISEAPALLQRRFPPMLTARLLLIGVYALVVFAAALLAGFHHPADLALLGGIILMQAFNYLMMFFRSNVAALQRFRLDGLLSVADRGLMIIVCGLLLLVPATAARFSIFTFVWVQLSCYALAALLALLALKRISRIRIRFSFRPAELWVIMRQSFPYALLVFLMAIYMRSDSLLIERLSGAAGREQAGIYAAAYRPLDAFNMLAVLLAGILLPLFGRMLAQKENPAVIVRLCMNLLFPLSLLMVALSVFYGTAIMQLLYPAADAYEGLVFSCLMTAVPGYTILYIYSTLLTAAGKLKTLHLISFLGIVVNVGLNLVLVPRYAALGAAVSAGITMSVLGICFIAAAHRHIALPHNPRWIAAQLSFGILLGLWALLLWLAPWPWLYRLLLTGAGGGLLMLLFRFISWKDLKLLLKRR